MPLNVIVSTVQLLRGPPLNMVHGHWRTKKERGIPDGESLCSFGSFGMICGFIRSLPLTPQKASSFSFENKVQSVTYINSDQLTISNLEQPKTHYLLLLQAETTQTKTTDDVRQLLSSRRFPAWLS
jgi:hypothetical protein